MVSAIAALVVGGGWLALRPRPRANRLLVVLETETRDAVVGAWWLPTGGRASARCADRLQERLGALGLEVVPAGSPEAGKRLADRTTADELVEAAPRLDAALVLVGRLRVVAAQPLPGSDGQSDYALELDAELRSATEPAAQRLGASPPRWHLSAADEPSALLAACAELPPRVAPLVASAVAELPSVRDMLAREARQRRLDERIALERLAPTLELARRTAEARAARDKLERERQEQDARQEQGTAPKHLLGSFLGEEYWIGAGPGSDVVVMSLPTWDCLAADGTNRFERQAEHEQLQLARADGSERRTLLETYNIFSYPSVSADGAHVAVVLDHRQWSKTLTVVDVADGRAHDVVSHRSHYYSSPLLSPDGSALLFWSSPSRDGDPSLELVRIDGSGRQVLVAAPFVRMDTPAWSPDGHSVYVSLQAQGEARSSLWRFDPATGERTLLLGGAGGGADASALERTSDVRPGPAKGAAAQAEPSSSWHRPSPAPDGSYLVLVEQSGLDGWLGSLALPSGPYRRLSRLPVGRIVVSPDSRTIACEVAPTRDPDDPRLDDVEIALLPAAGGEPRLLTRNRVDDALGGWARDGRKLYLQQRDPELEGGRASHRIYWLEP